MEAQWPLIIFTLFVCLTCGIFGAMSILALKGQGRQLQFTSLISATVSLAIGGFGAFLHLEHWERIFNGFGHITSGITQELIGCVALAVIIVAWFVVLRGGKEIPKALAWITLAVAVLMLVATGHSYLMPARPAWGIALIVFYVANACLLGAVAMWLISIMKKDEASEGSSIQFALVGSVVQLAAMAVYTIACSMTKFADFGFYADPTSMTTAPTHVDSLLAIMVSGDGALMFWCSIACAVVALVCAIAAKKKVGASKPYMIIAVIVAIASSILFRVLFYQLGFAMVLLY
ncbi:dimethyl sulfoxide reductase anchor subunit family protein [Raoultibacter timonensis]|uniref:dimethyl sulfoxide reductase anchor subunit family protein n=1 Tax=Raoultibacter timonensis TaxID=1907662 RepID=UPI000C848A0C|nr:DmsC/YnfH family molybdoenzyme membrane anchor subunit [Raoultibacter timonensis]